MEALALALFVLSYLIAVAGVILPLLPGVPLAALGALIAGWLTGFSRLGAGALALVAALALLSLALDYLAGMIGARRFGASRAGVAGSLIGGLVGLIFFPPLGFLLGALVGAVALELLSGRPLAAALRAGVGVFIGTLGGIVAKLLILVAIGITVFPRLL